MQTGDEVRDAHRSNKTKREDANPNEDVFRKRLPNHLNESRYTFTLWSVVRRGTGARMTFRDTTHHCAFPQHALVVDDTGDG